MDKLPLSDEEKAVLKEKIKLLKQGYDVFPPAYWFYFMKQKVSETYPKYENIRAEFRPVSVEEFYKLPKEKQEAIMNECWNRISASIWWHYYTPEQKIGIIERILKGEDGIPYQIEKLTKEQIEQILRGKVIPKEKLEEVKK
jgi:hypothetical protein